VTRTLPIAFVALALSAGNASAATGAATAPASGAAAPTTTYAPPATATSLPAKGAGDAPTGTGTTTQPSSIATAPATTTGTPAPTTSAPATSTPQGDVLGTLTLTNRGTATKAKSQGDSGLSTGAIVIAAFAALLLLACILWALARRRAVEPHWLLSLRHAMAEAGFRASATWSEFADWARLGR
jgi:cobalamin biosynthesis Mg chelatase CobN